jgi:hypothetical protein
VFNFTGLEWLPGMMGRIDDGSLGLYAAGTPDVILPADLSVSPMLAYPGVAAGVAAVHHPGVEGRGQVFYLTFPFETIADQAGRAALFSQIVNRFARRPRLECVAQGDYIDIFVTGEPGMRYRMETSTDLRLWTPQMTFPSGDGRTSIRFLAPQSGAYFFRVGQ